MGPGIIASLRAHAGGARCWRALACVLLALAPFTPVAATTTDSAYSIVSMIDPNSIVRVEDMDFGNILQPNAAGTVLLTPGLISSCATTGGLIRTSSCKAAHFTVKGRQGKRIMMREEDGGSIVLQGPGGATMTVTDFTVAVLDMSDRQGAGGWDFGSWNINGTGGIADFWVGGTLHVAAGQAEGIYVGTLDLRIQAN